MRACWLLLGVVGGCDWLVNSNPGDPRADAPVVTDAGPCAGRCETGYLKPLVLPANPPQPAAFATSLAISIDGRVVISGAPGHQTAYVHAWNGGQWELRNQLNPFPSLSSWGAAVALSSDARTAAIGAPATSSQVAGAGTVWVFVNSGDLSWFQEAGLEAPSADTGDELGASVALSADGNVLAIGAPGEASASAADPANDAAPGAGAVYVYTRANAMWTLQAYLKASNTGAGDRFGTSVALSADGSILAVGAPREDSAGRGPGASQTNDGAVDAGAVYVFQRAGATWAQTAYLKASNADAFDAFGVSVSLSAPGILLVVGAPGEDSQAQGLDGNQADNAAPQAGAAYVFELGTTWTQSAYVKASNTNPAVMAFAPDSSFGASVAFSPDGSQFVVGAPLEASAARGIDGDQTSVAAPYAGAAYVFARPSTTWMQTAYLKASNAEAPDWFGRTVAASLHRPDGASIVVGAPFEDSNAGPDDNSLDDNGAAYVFQIR